MPPQVAFSLSASDGSSLAGNLSDIGAWAELDDGSTSFTGSMFGSSWHLSWTTVVNHTAELLRLDTMLSITNTSDTAQRFDLTTLYSPIDDTAGGLLDVASSISVMNLALNGTASLSTADEVSLVRAGVGDSAAIALYEPLFELIAAGPYGVNTTTQAGSGSAAAGSSATWHDSSFLLSSGDLATIHTTSTVTPIPGPGGVALLVVAALGARRRSHRR